MALPDSPSASDISPDTEELATELSERKPDSHRVRWLIERGADVARAMSLAHIKEQDLLKSATLRPLGLQRYLHGHGER